MWKHILEGLAGSPAEQLSLALGEAVSWRRILVEGGLLLALLLTSSWLVRG